MSQNLQPNLKSKLFLPIKLHSRTADDSGGAYLSVPDSSFLEVRNAVDAVYQALTAASLDVDQGCQMAIARF